MSATKVGITMEPSDDGVELDRFPFHGSVEFDLTVAVIGVRCVRRVRVLYGCIPNWEFCHRDGTLRLGQDIGGITACRYRVMTGAPGADTPASDATQQAQDGQQALWAASSVPLDPDLLDDAMHERIERLVKAQVRREDTARRRLHGLLPVPGGGRGGQPGAARIPGVHGQLNSKNDVCHDAAVDQRPPATCPHRRQVPGGAPAQGDGQGNSQAGHQPAAVRRSGNVRTDRRDAAAVEAQGSRRPAKDR